MKTLIFIALALAALACEKIPYISCQDGCYGYLSITAEYQWISVRAVGDTGKYHHIWYGQQTTRTASLPAGRYEIGHAEPQPKNDRDKAMMLRNEYAPLPGFWSDDTISIASCDTLRVRF